MNPRPAAPLPWLRARPAWAAFLVTAAWFGFLHVHYGVHTLLHDARLYWQLATDPGAVPAWMHVRGYLLPLVLGVALRAGDTLGLQDLTTFAIVSSLGGALVTAVILPDLMLRLAGGRDSAWRRIVPGLLVGVVFPGLIVYPLTDLFALGLLWAALLALLRAHEAAQAGLLRAAWPHAALAGLLAAAAYNTRTVYLFSLLLLVPLAAWLLRRRPALLATSVVAGLIVCAPQVRINVALHGVASANPAVAFNLESRSLFATQLAWGLTAQKYETLLRASPGASLVYLDPAGVRLWDETLSKDPPRAVVDYAGVVSGHPVFWIGMMGRHLANGLDVQDALVYVDDPGKDRSSRGLLAFTIFLATLLVAALTARARTAVASNSPPAVLRMLACGVLLAPAVAVLPGVMETRFLLPLQAFVYVAAATGWDTAALREGLRRHGTPVAAAALAAWLLVLAIVRATGPAATIM